MSDKRNDGAASVVVVIEPNGSGVLDWRNFYAFRELFFILAWRDISVRYKQTLLGIVWVILRPLVTILVFTIVFGKLANVPSVGNVAYALVVCTGLLPWYLMSLSLVDMAGSLVSNATIVTKVYFPRLILPIAALLVNLVDFAASLVVLLGLCLWFGVMPGWQILFMPFVILMAIAVIIGPGLLFAALNVKYRDFRYIIPFLVQVGLYISPVGFSIAIVPENWRLIYSINPVVGVVESFRWSILGDQSPIYWPSVAISLLFSVAALWLGVTVFRRAEKKIADVI